MPTTSTLKGPSAGGRLGRLLASLRPPTRAGPLPVQTGFPTSLADLVVQHHVRLKNPRKRRSSAAAAPSFPAPAVAVSAAEPPPPEQQGRRDVVVVEAAAVRSKAAAFSIRPELLMVAGAVALALLVVWSKTLVAAATLLSVALFWIESVRSSEYRRRWRPAGTKGPDFCGRGAVSPIREAESAASTPRLGSAGSDSGSEAADSRDLSGGDDSVTPKRKGKRRSLRKLIARKLNPGKRSRDQDAPGSPAGGEIRQPDAGDVGITAGTVKTEPLLVAPAEQTAAAVAAEEAIGDERCRRGCALPLAAFIPVILVGLVVGTLPAVALTVVCAVFFTSAERVPPPGS